MKYVVGLGLQIPKTLLMLCRWWLNSLFNKSWDKSLMIGYTDLERFANSLANLEHVTLYFDNLVDKNGTLSMILRGIFLLHCEYMHVQVDPGGATRMARGGIRLVHGVTKSTLITFFSGMKIDPKYAFLRAFFLICLSCSFQNLSIWPKTHPFFLFCPFVHP